MSGVYSIPEPTALAFSFGYHLGGFVPITVIGLVCASRLGFSLRELRTSELMLAEPIDPSAEARPAGVEDDGSGWGESEGRKLNV